MKQIGNEQYMIYCIILDDITWSEIWVMPNLVVLNDYSEKVVFLCFILC